MMVIDVSNNKITEIPRALPFYLENINFLNVQNNDIVSIPNLLGLHQNLQNLQIAGNPIKSVRIAVVSKGSDAIKAYLSDKFNPAVDTEIEPWAKNAAPVEANYKPQIYTQEAPTPGFGPPQGGYQSHPTESDANYQAKQHEANLTSGDPYASQKAMQQDVSHH